MSLVDLFLTGGHTGTNPAHGVTVKSHPVEALNLP
jgi:hypothetical protein